MMADVLPGKEAGTVTGLNVDDPSKDILIANRMQMKPTGKSISKSCRRVTNKIRYPNKVCFTSLYQQIMNSHFQQDFVCDRSHFASKERNRLGE
jgi:hypothetical protein